MAEATRTPERGPERNARAPEEPTDLKLSSWWAVLTRPAKECREEPLTHWAAALTYHALLSICPALLVMVSVLGLIGASATQPLLDNLSEVAPAPAQEIFTDAIENLNQSQG